MQDSRISAVPGEDRTESRPSAHPEKRTEFRRDRDRVYYSDEFRRLEGVTQVASAVSGRVHNRMTHSYRVEQIARSIAIHLSSSLVDEEVVAAAALAHDLGHPPFGHNGENELQKILICAEHAVSDKGAIKDEHRLLEPTCSKRRPCLARDSFEGNAQTFHMVAALAAKSGNTVELKGELLDGQVRVGLDLTRRTLNALLKYPWVRGGNRTKAGKWSVYELDRHTFDWATEGVSEARRGVASLEAQVMDSSDDIAYAVHDVEDFYRLGVIPLWQIQVDTLDFERFMEYLTSKDDLADELKPLVAEHAKRLKQRLEPGANLTVTADAFPHLDAVQNLCLQFPVARYEDDHESVEALSLFRSQLITEFVSSVSIDGDDLIYSESVVATKLHFLKMLTWFYAISSPAVQALKIGQRGIVRRCFTSLYERAFDHWVQPKTVEPLRPTTSLREAKEGDRSQLHPRLVSFYKINLQYFHAAKRVAGARREDDEDQLVRAVIARSVIDYMCSLSDSEIYDLADQLDGRLSERSVLNAYVARI